MEENTNVNLDDLQEVVVGESKTESTGVQLGMTVLEESSKNYTIQLGSNEYMQIIGTPEQRQEMFEAWAGYIGEVSNPLKTAANYNKGRYAPLNEVLDETRPLLSKYGFGLMQFPRIEGTKVAVTTALTFKNGACWTFPPLVMNAAKDDAQTLIATVTYNRRAALNTILVVYGEEDDDGNTAASGKSPKRQAVKKTDLSELEIAVQDIIKLCSQKVRTGMDKELLYNTIQEYNNGNRQPNTIPDMETAKTIMAKLKELK